MTFWPGCPQPWNWPLSRSSCPPSSASRWACWPPSIATRGWIMSCGSSRYRAWPSRHSGWRFCSSFFLRWNGGITPLQGRVDGWGPDEVTGFFLIDAAIAGDWDIFWDVAHHMILPRRDAGLSRHGDCYAVHPGGPCWTLSIRTMLITSKPWACRAAVVIWRYVLRNALIGTVTQLGLIFGNLIANAVVVEAVFDWPGLGLYAVNSILQSDYNAIMGFTLTMGCVFIIANLLVDISHGLIDPREAR